MNINYEKILFIGLVYLSVMCKASDDWWASEFAKMKRAQQSRRKQEDGFQGCVNKATCGFGGYYLAEYSPEGLCNDCELQRFPERYVACLFCRRPYHKINPAQKSGCTSCFNILGEALEKTLLKGKNYNLAERHVVMCGVLAFFRNLEKEPITRKPIEAFSKSKERYINDLDRKILIYLGTRQLSPTTYRHCWMTQLPDIDSNDIKTIHTKEEVKELAQSIFEKYKLAGNETYAVLDEVPSDNVVTYLEERK